MIKIVKADKYSHCSSCGKANEYYCINAHTPDVAKICMMKFGINDSKQVYSFGFCRKCLKKLRKEVNCILKSEEVEE